MVERVRAKPEQCHLVICFQRLKRNHVTIAGSDAIFDLRVCRPVCSPGNCRRHPCNVRRGYRSYDEKRRSAAAAAAAAVPAPCHARRPCSNDGASANESQKITPVASEHSFHEHVPTFHRHNSFTPDCVVTYFIDTTALRLTASLLVINEGADTYCSSFS
jgi:hypothetical protein